VITQAHFQYTPFVAPATEFLISQIDAKKGGIVPGTGAAAPATAPVAGGEMMEAKGSGAKGKDAKGGVKEKGNGGMGGMAPPPKESGGEAMDGMEGMVL